MAQTNEIIESFLKHYEQGYYFYDKLATLVADQCEKKVNESSIRAIVTSRAKKIKSLKEKIYQRHKTKNYQSETAIFEDIVDLAGVRIALYFPADRARVENFIKDIFIIIEEKPFPRPKTENEKDKDKDKNKFDGYHADHYRVMLKSETLEDKNKDCANYIIEIQVASILMHAWAEVNHDLAYKPSSGELSKQESSILDGLNGLVLTGEVLLEQLQSAFQERVAHQKEPFANQYELAAFIRKQLENSGLYFDVADIAMGRIEILFEFLTIKKLNNPNDIYLLVNKLDADIDEFPIVDRIFDILFEKNIDFYYVYYDLLMYDHKSRKVEVDRCDIKILIKILKKQIMLRRYIRCLAYYKSIKEDDLSHQEDVLRHLSEFEELFHNIYINDLVRNIFYCVHHYNYVGLDLNELEKTIIQTVNRLEQFNHLDSKKAMEWARSGQLELPEK